MKHSIVSLLYTFVLISIQGFSSHAFCPTFSALQHRHATTHSSHASSLSSSSQLKPTSFVTSRGLILRSSPSDDEWNELSESDQILLGSLGTFAAIVVGYSEFTLKTTGCGLPAGPFGIYGLIEGLSYLGVTGIAAYATVTKVKTGSGLPAGPGGLLGAAEGLSFLAIVVGLVVLALQVTNYGYIPNAVPMEGAMCS